MIPTLTSSGVLPPFPPDIGPTTSSGMSPYDTTLVELANSFAFSPKRVALLKGLIQYRKTLREIGINTGFQWIDGSYIEDCEGSRQRPPKDIDLVTFAERPSQCKDPAAWAEFVTTNRQSLVDRAHIKTAYFCDAFYVDLDLPGKAIVSRTHFYFGLFSHQRVSYTWKGILRIPLMADDDAALSTLGGEGDAT